jgi:hypothetical protein
MVATFRTWDARSVTVSPVVKNLPTGTYGVYVDGKIRMVKEVAGEGNGDGDGIEVALVVEESEVDVVVLRARSTYHTTGKL